MAPIPALCLILWVDAASASSRATSQSLCVAFQQMSWHWPYVLNMAMMHGLPTGCCSDQ